MGFADHPLRRRNRLVTMALTVGLAVSTSVIGGATAGAARGPETRTPTFDQPSGLAADAGRLWVTNQGNNSVTEVNPSTRGLVRTIKAKRYRLSSPVGIVAHGTDLFVANSQGSVTEILARNGAWVRTISAGRYDFKSPVALVGDGRDIDVLNGTGAITEIRASTGAFVRRIAGRRYKMDGAVALTVVGKDLFVANETNSTVAEIVAGTGRLVRIISGGGIDGPAGIGYGKGHVWVADSASNSDTEINARTGKVITTISSGSYGFGTPSITLVASGHVYVASPPGSSPMVTMFSARTGALAWYWCNTNGPYDFSNPDAFAITGGNLFVANEGNNSLTEMNAVTGALVTNFT